MNNLFLITIFFLFGITAEDEASQEGNQLKCSSYHRLSVHSSSAGNSKEKDVFFLKAYFETISTTAQNL